MNRFVFRFLALVALGLPVVAAAQTARERLETFAKGLDGLNGTFVQEVFDVNGKSTETSRGTLSLRAPRQFRWQYEAPFPQLIVADGDNVWIYDEDLAQVTVRPQALEEAQSPLTVLTDLSQLDREYKVSARPDADGLSWLRLTPKNDEASFKSCDLGFSGAALARMVVRDQLGQRNEMRFGAWDRNPSFDAAKFQFTVPEGVDVVGEPVRNADTYPIKN